MGATQSKGSAAEGRNHFDTLIEGGEFSAAAEAVNDRYRELSLLILEVIEDLLTVLVRETFLGDMSNVCHRAGFCRPSWRRRFRAFVDDRRAQNCLTAVLNSQRRQAPPACRSGLLSVRHYFHDTNFYEAFQEDVFFYEPEVSALDDRRFARLLSEGPNAVDLELLDEQARALKDEVLEAYREEAGAPMRSAFIETVGRCRELFEVMEEYARDMRFFYTGLRGAGFEADEGMLGEWQELGERYLSIELLKSSIMLPIKPKELHPGLEKEFPRALERLALLREAVTPKIEIPLPEMDGREAVFSLHCRNPDTLREEPLLIEVNQISRSTDFEGGEEVALGYHITETTPRRDYRFRVTEFSQPLSLVVRLTAGARFFPKPFVQERRIDL